MKKCFYHLTNCYSGLLIPAGKCILTDTQAEFLEPVETDRDRDTCYRKDLDQAQVISEYFPLSEWVLLESGLKNKPWKLNCDYDWIDSERTLKTFTSLECVHISKWGQNLQPGWHPRSCKPGEAGFVFLLETFVYIPKGRNSEPFPSLPWENKFLSREGEGKSCPSHI